jgi:transporter family protein
MTNPEDDDTDDDSMYHHRNFPTGTSTSTSTGSTRSIGGRLGGHLRVSTLEQQLLLEESDEEATEGTSLIHKKKAILSHSLSHSPPLTVWIVPALSCAAAYAFYNIFIKKGSAGINPILGGVVLQFVAATLGTLLLGSIIWTGGENALSQIHYDKSGMIWSICAGLAVGSAEMLSFFVSSLGVQASQFIPIIIGGSVMFGAVLGLLVLGEKMMMHGWCGVALLVTGIALVATDPGDKMEEGGVEEMDPPPLVAWIIPALVCASMYAFYNIFIKKGSASINPILGGVVLQFVAAIFGSLLLGGVILREGGAQELEVSGTGIFWACCAGIAVGTAEMLSFCVSGMGVDASKSIPIIIGGSVMFGAVLGLLMLGETLMFQGWFGVAVLMTGVGLVATDPGEKMPGH